MKFDAEQHSSAYANSNGWAGLAFDAWGERVLMTNGYYATREDAIAAAKAEHEAEMAAARECADQY